LAAFARFVGGFGGADACGEGFAEGCFFFWLVLGKEGGERDDDDDGNVMLKEGRKEEKGEEVLMGRMPWSVQLMSMLPWGQPEPPEMTFLILKESGACDVGAAVARAARARVGSVNFMVSCLFVFVFRYGRVWKVACKR
jgi:hypothetical protein